MRNKILMTLALLLTAVGGAWADETLLLTIESKDYVSFTTGSKTFDDKVTVTFSNWAVNDNNDYGWYAGEASLLTVTGINGYTITSCKFYTRDGDTDGYTVEGESPSVYLYVGDVFTDVNQSEKIGSPGVTKIEVYGPAPDPAVDVTPVTGKTNEWTFTMPAYDVEIAPIYAPVAQWAKVDNVDQLPTAVEGIYAESTNAIVKAGTVAKIGATENPQGIVMYAVTNEAKAPALTAFSADVPTAKNITAAGDVLVWYYIKGADTPEGQEATAENTFNDSEICAEPITVTLLSNKFDIQFKAANANTIEAGKATVTVGGTAATVTEGKLTGVKMGTEVKVKAKEGYKFRKVEVKKGGLLSIEIGGHATATIYYVEGETWGEAMQNHPEENSAWKIDPSGVISNQGYVLSAGGNFVFGSDTIDPNAGYSFKLT